MPVCSNCGSEEFVWVDAVRTGSFVRAPLALRPGGELALGTRVCRGCGHADLFVKDLTVLRDPKRWAPGEFVVVPPGTPSHLVPPPWMEPPPISRPPSSSGSPPPTTDPSPPLAPGPTPEAVSPEPKRTPRRRAPSRPKGDGPSLIHD